MKKKTQTIQKREHRGLENFMSKSQMLDLWMALRSEEKQHFRALLQNIGKTLDYMPQTGETEGLGNAAICHLHYFRGGADAWIVELDKGSPDDEPEDYQAQAFGLVDLGYGAELGYISIPELTSAGMELDLYWQPVTVATIKAKRGAE